MENHFSLHCTELLFWSFEWRKGRRKTEEVCVFLAQSCTKILHFLDRNFLTKNNGLKNERNRRNLSSERGKSLRFCMLDRKVARGIKCKIAACYYCSGFRVGWTKGLYTSCILEISRSVKSLGSYWLLHSWKFWVCFDFEKKLLVLMQKRLE